MFKLVDRFPHVGILAGVSGLATSVLALIHIFSLVFGLAGAVFGCLAGFYTWRIQRLKFKHLVHPSKK